MPADLIDTPADFLIDTSADFRIDTSATPADFLIDTSDDFLIDSCCIGDVALGARSVAQVAMAKFYAKDLEEASANPLNTLKALSSWKATRWGQTQAYKMNQHALVKGHYFGVAMLLQESNASFREAFSGWDLIDPSEQVARRAPKKAKTATGPTGGAIHKRTNKPAVP